jgi:hypothetical protein
MVTDVQSQIPISSYITYLIWKFWPTKSNNASRIILSILAEENIHSAIRLTTNDYTGLTGLKIRVYKETPNTQS